MTFRELHRKAFTAAGISAVAAYLFWATIHLVGWKVPHQNGPLMQESWLLLSRWWDILALPLTVLAFYYIQWFNGRLAEVTRKKTESSFWELFLNIALIIFSIRVGALFFHATLLGYYTSGFLMGAPILFSCRDIIGKNGEFSSRSNALLGNACIISTYAMLGLTFIVGTLGGFAPSAITFASMWIGTQTFLALVTFTRIPAAISRTVMKKEETETLAAIKTLVG
jgi:hypothetical protein